MFNSKFKIARLFLVVAFFLNLSLQTAHCAPEGTVDVALEWGPAVKASYTYVFSGQVTCENHPCPNARVDLDLDTVGEGVISQSTQAGDDGRYQMEITIVGAPAESSGWKLEAHTSGVSSQESAESEGRIILMEGQTKITVDRALLLIQA